MPSDDDTPARDAERLELLDAIAWATENGHDLLDLAAAADTVEDALDALTARGFSREAALACLDTGVRRWTRDNVARIEAERRELRDRLRN